MSSYRGGRESCDSPRTKACRRSGYALAMVPLALKNNDQPLRVRDRRAEPEVTCRAGNEAPAAGCGESDGVNVAWISL
jgi:hypothetical protein